MWRLMLEFPFFNTIFQDSSRILSGLFRDFGRNNDSSRCKGLTCNGLLLAFGILKVEKVRVGN